VSAVAHATLPAAERACEEYAFAGHSGARVMLHAGGRRSFVRKTAAAPSHNERLLDQAEKQRHLARIGIAFPQVFASGVDDRACAFFDMAYVPGRTLAFAVANSIPFAPGPVFAAIERMLWLFQACRGTALPAAAFHAKIEAIADGARGDAAAQDCAQLLLDRDWDGIPDSPSHGDLTLENIMLGPERGVVFIDCDQPFVSSYWLDMGKLFQDLYGHWCLRRLYAARAAQIQRANAIEKLMQLESMFRPLVAREEPGLAERLHQLAALSLFRALPYATEPETAAFICTRIRRVLEH
jgi:aminoglycoside phosphotransferase